jgi:tetratricopeptide (TPR) repeat protein
MIDESQIANINSNPDRILQLIEKVNCDLPQIYESLKSFGEITDDLSLLKIHFHKNPTPPKEDHVDINIILDFTEKNFLEKKYEDAVKFLISKINEFPEEYILLKYLSDLYCKIGKYKAAATTGMRYLELAPSDSDFFYLLSTYYKMSADYSAGIEISERLRLRDPQNLRNLLNLAELYSLAQNYKRAEELLQYYLKLDPENSIALNLSDSVKKIQSK